MTEAQAICFVFDLSSWRASLRVGRERKDHLIRKSRRVCIHSQLAPSQKVSAIRPCMVHELYNGFIVIRLLRWYLLGHEAQHRDLPLARPPLGGDIFC